LVLGFAVGAIACSAVAYLVPMVVTGAVPLSPSAAALPEPASLLPMPAAHADTRAAWLGVALVGTHLAVARNRRRLHACRLARGHASGCGGHPTGTF